MGNKFLGVQNIVDLSVKKVAASILEAEAAKQGVSYSTMKRAWMNFTQFGIVDRRGTGRLEPSQKLAVKERNKKYFTGLKWINATPQMACDIIREYAFTDIKAVALFKKYGLNPHQFYNWLKELEVAGEVLGKTIFDVTKYLKPKVKTVVEYSKYPWRFEKTDPILVAQYKRILTVLKEYL